MKEFSIRFLTSPALFPCVLPARELAAAEIINLRTLGARGDGMTLETQMLQKTGNSRDVPGS